jgi:Tol biopolymer transport system component
VARWAAVVAAAGFVTLPLGAAGAPRSVAAAAGTLVFYSNRTVNGGLYAMPAAGGPLRVLAHGTRDLAPQWSPDGRYLAYLREVPSTGSSDLWVRSANGAGARLLAHEAGQPTWAPDAKTLAFGHADRIWTVRVNGSALHAVTTPASGTLDGEPVWSPNGSLIAFLRSAGGSSSRLMAVEPSGHALRRIASRVFFAASWSPNGVRIAFDSSGPNGTGSFSPRLYVANPDGSHRLNLAPLNGNLAWSPNGTWIAYGGGGTSALSVIHPNGTGRRRLANADLSSQPAWSPGSGRIAFARGRPADVWTVDLHGVQHRLTAGWRYGYTNESPAWHPTGRRASALGGRVVPAPIPPDGVVVNGVLQATHPVAALAADANRVAMTYAGGTRCIETWNPSTGVRIHFPACNLPRGAMTMADITRVAIAGPRVAWGFFEHALGTNSYGLFVATLSAPNPRVVTGLCSTPGGICVRAPVGDLVGAGSLLAFDSWLGPEPYCNLPCPPPKHDGRLDRIDTASAMQIAASATALTPLAADNGRILVDAGNGTLVVTDANGTPLRSVSAPGFTEANLQGSDLVAHVGAVLDDFDATTGMLLHAWPVPAASVLEDVQGGIAVYVVGTAVHLLRLANGHDAAINAAGSGPVRAQLQPAGLFYSYVVSGGTRPGRVAFVPSSALP